MGNNKFITSIS